MYYWLEARPADRIDTTESPFPIDAASLKGQPLDIIYCGAGQHNTSHARSAQYQHKTLHTLVLQRVTFVLCR